MNENISKILAAFPFLSYGVFDEREYIGIIQNSDNSLLSMYVLDMIPDEELRRLFLKYGEDWWWGSNRQIPINIFFKEQFLGFRPYLRHFSRKDFNLVQGHAVSLQEQAQVNLNIRASISFSKAKVTLNVLLFEESTRKFHLVLFILHQEYMRATSLRVME
jgi:hypothetical protein